MDKNELLRIMQEKQSQLCIGLDLVGTIDDKLPVAMEIIDQTADLAAAYKPNRQYWLGATQERLQELNKHIHHHRCASIIDHKLSDIGSTNAAALNQSKMEGFDLITVSPFPGNLRGTSRLASSIGIGLISLVMMSNPESIWLKESGMYRSWAADAQLYADGIVVGTTNHVTVDVLQEIASLTPNTIVLAPGIGAQGGEPAAIKEIFGSRVLFNVSRGISKADNYREAAEHYSRLIG